MSARELPLVAYISSLLTRGQSCPNPDNTFPGKSFDETALSTSSNSYYCYYASLG